MNLSRAGEPGKTNTGIHRKLRELIRDNGFRYDEEHLVPGPRNANYSLDFYLPEFHVGLEADGPWHQKTKDAIRDRWISETTGILILRFTSEDLSDKILAARRLVEFCDTSWHTMDNRRGE